MAQPRNSQVLGSSIYKEDSKKFSDNQSGVFGEFDKGSGLNVPLLDYSEGSHSYDGNNSSNQ